ncbi:hypothetical protein CHS0354_008412 [Potamilus streckersoni]|uniref:MIP18 family-like domain-containing protein n=1 Tax=Potamilus streckersoni TaxID=2493646 RepID=A0AAE0RPM2_9BIVA|nr:hypothetical protein CHS0354_008412 [Potamilus streckersoni]
MTDSTDTELVTIQETVYDLIRSIRDPEKAETLEELNVVSEESVTVKRFNSDEYLIKIEFIPTVPHCSLASLIGLCLREKLQKNFTERHKLDIFIKEGTHETVNEINKQINDKERIAAAMENPNLQKLVNECLTDEN